MRITIHIPDEIGEEIRRVATNEKKSVSSVVAQSIEFFIKQKNREQLGGKILKLAGKTRLSPDVLEYLEFGREEIDRL